VFYGGDLTGINQSLDYLQELGVNALYLNPVFTAYSNHKYDVADYENVDPHFGGNQALLALRRSLDERGMRYMLDIVPNHCGFWHPWFQAARQDASAPEAEFFTFMQHPEEYASWLGVWSLPKLNYRSQELRRRIYAGPQAVFRRWLQPPYAADGWRVDVANMLARQGPTQMGAEIARGIRQAVKETQPQAYLLGENFFDASAQLQGDQWDGVMNYRGLAFPLLDWLRGFKRWAHGMGEAICSPQPWPTQALATMLQERLAAIPWCVALQQYNLLDSHDTPRLRSELGDNDALQRLAAIVQFSFPGVPGLYYGDEIGMLDTPGLDSRGCMIWDRQRWNLDLFAFYQRLIALRRASPILQHGGFQILAVEEDLLAYQREAAAGRILVIAQRNLTPRPAAPLAVAHGAIPDGAAFTEYFSGCRSVVSNGRLPLPDLPQGGSLWLED
jgi:alpha-glucosidase